MITLGDALGDSFASDAEHHNHLDARRTIAAIRRRRTVRAAGAGSATVVAIGAVGTVWWLAPGGRTATPAEPGAGNTCTAADLYLPPNPAALGEAPIDFRVYSDPRPSSPRHGMVVVTPDGTVTRLTASSAGEYRFEGVSIGAEDASDAANREPLVVDWVDNTGSGTDWDGDSPFLKDYHWTTVVPHAVPDGVDAAGLSYVLRVVTGLGGGAYADRFVPEGAVADAIVTTSVGTTEYRLAEGDSMPTLAFADNVVSVALRVSALPVGGTFTITSTFGEPDPALSACVADAQSATPSATVVPRESLAPDPSVSQAPVAEPLSGPESYVFACGVALPPELEGDLGLDVRWGAGTIVYESLGGVVGARVELGAGGVVAAGELPAQGPLAGALDASGWAQTYSDSTSLATYLTVVAARQDGVIVGTVVPSATHAEGVVPEDTSTFGYPYPADGDFPVSMTIPNVDARMAPCPGVDDAQLEGADTIALLGTGPVGGGYTFAWTRVER